MANFAAIADIEAFLQIEITEAASANRALAEATEAIRNYTHQYLEKVEEDEITLDVKPGERLGPTRLRLPELPVIEIQSVIENGEMLTADVDYQLGQHGTLYRLDSWQEVGARWKTGVQVVTITYSHGYDTLPDDIVSVATRAAARAYQAGLRSAESEGLSGVTSKSLGDFSVGFAAETGGGGTGEGVMGASAARMLLLSEQDILDRYRV